MGFAAFSGSVDLNMENQWRLVPLNSLLDALLIGHRINARLIHGIAAVIGLELFLRTLFKKITVYHK